MGSVVYLALGSLEINWGKNNYLTLHGELFQKSDVTLVPDVYVDDDGKKFTRMQCGAARPLRKIVPRLELLGYTLATARESFDFTVSVSGCDEPPISFDELADALRQVDIDSGAADYHEDYDYGEFFAREIFDRLRIGLRPDREYQRFELGQVMENLDPYVVLRLLAENPANLDRLVTWHYNDIVENGWVDAKTIDDSIGASRKFLVVTEGSSDSKILRHALELLRPDTSDFFTFVDMEEGYPFTGTGNLYRFCQGLVAIGIENQVVVLYDNDLEGSLKCADTQALRLPPNMRVTKLPALTALEAFPVIGPHGVSAADINGTAASIECYLDLSFGEDRPHMVRWTSFVEKANAYQGALLYKETYARRFLRLRERGGSYDFSRLDAVLDHLFKVCFDLAQTAQSDRSGKEVNRG